MQNPNTQKVQKNAINFIGTDHNMHIFGVIPFIKLQSKQQLNGEQWWKMRPRTKTCVFGWAVFLCPMKKSKNDHRSG